MQLWNNLNCTNFKISKLQNVDYKKNDLLKFFKDYGSCANVELSYFIQKIKRDPFNLTMRPRFNASTLSIESSVLNFRNNNFGNKTNFGFGVEAEFILPFNKNKWSIIIEPTYHYFNSEQKKSPTNVTGGDLTVIVDYNSFEVPLGIRHYFFLNNESKLFANVSYVFDKSLNSSVEFNRNDGSNFLELEIATRNNFAFGLGYKYNDKYGFEVRYQTYREVLGNYAYWNSEYKTLSVILGYSIF